MYTVRALKTIPSRSRSGFMYADYPQDYTSVPNFDSCFFTFRCLSLGWFLLNSTRQFKMTARKEIWLANMKWDLLKMFRFTMIYLTMKSLCHDYCRQYLKIDHHTIVDWGSFMQEVFLHYCITNTVTQIGGKGYIVEVDEAKIGHWKYNRGRIIQGQWVFGGIKRGTKKLFLVAVKKRNQPTLLKEIKKRIQLG